MGNFWRVRFFSLNGLSRNFWILRISKSSNKQKGGLLNLQKKKTSIPLTRPTSTGKRSHKKKLLWCLSTQFEKYDSKFLGQFPPSFWPENSNHVGSNHHPTQRGIHPKREALRLDLPFVALLCLLLGWLVKPPGWRGHVSEQAACCMWGVS